MFSGVSGSGAGGGLNHGKIGCFCFGCCMGCGASGGRWSMTSSTCINTLCSLATISCDCFGSGSDRSSVGVVGLERLELRCIGCSSYGVVGCGGSRLPSQVGGLVGETLEGVVGCPGLVGVSFMTMSCTLGVVIVVGDGFCTGARSNLGGGPAGGLRNSGGTHPRFGLGCMTVVVLVEVVVVVSTSSAGGASDMSSQGLSMGLLSATSEDFQESSCLLYTSPSPRDRG